MLRQRQWAIACSWLVAGFLVGAEADAQAPSLSHAVPAAVIPGQDVDVTFHGGGLAGVTGIWTSIPAAAALTPGVENNGQDAAKVTYRINVPAGTQPGVFGVRISGGGGISNLRLVMVDDLPSLLDNGANATPATAQELAIPVAVDGTCEAEAYDFYKFTGVAGQRVTIEVMAARLGSTLDPVIRLIDANGRELAYSDDEGGLAADCRLAHVLPADGQYLIEVKDIRYQGSAAHRYRLRIGDFPFATVPFPLAAKAGSTPKLSFAGPAVADVAAVDFNVAADAAAAVNVGLKSPGGAGSSYTRLAVSRGREAVEFEPNDTPEAASPISVPGALNGRFQSERDKDYYQFTAKQGERWIFRGKTRSLGSPTDLFLRLYGADGALLSEAEDAGTDEGAIDFTAPVEGAYRLMAEDLHRRGGPDHAYRIEAEPYRAGFSLAVDAEKYDAPKGGVFVVKVTSARVDYNGPITLSIEGAPGVSLAANVIAEGQNEVLMYATLPSSIETGTLSLIKIVGQARIGEVDFTATASAAVPLRAALGGYPFPPEELTSQVGLGVGPVFADFFKLSTDPAVVLYPQLVGASSFTVKLEKLNGFDEQVTLTVEGLPDEFAATVQPIAKGAAEMAIPLTGPAAPPEGDYKFRITGSSAFENQPKTVVLGDAVLRVIKPLVVTATPAGPLPIGGKQMLKLAVTRFGDEKGAVALELSNLPAGVTAAPAAIAEGATEVDVELTAAADAVAGKHEGIVVVAKTQVRGRDITVSGQPATIEINQP